MIRSITLLSASLLAAGGLSYFSHEAEARHYRNNDCCQQSGYSSHRHHGYYRSGYNYGYSGNGYYGGNRYYAGNQFYGYTGYAQVGYAGCQPTVAYAPVVTTACCAPQPTCCGGTSMTVTTTAPVNAPVVQPPMESNLGPAPTPGN